MEDDSENNSYAHNHLFEKEFERRNHICERCNTQKTPKQTTKKKPKQNNPEKDIDVTKPLICFCGLL